MARTYREAISASASIFTRRAFALELALAPAMPVCLIVGTLLERCLHLRLPMALRVSVLFLLATGVLFSSFAAFNPSLHEWFHCENDSPAHDDAPCGEPDCAVTLFATGSIESFEIPNIDSAFSPQLSASCPLLSHFALTEVKYRLLPGRAPPAVVI